MRNKQTGSHLPIVVNADVYARMPEALHHQGEPNEWVRTSRPGMRIGSFLEGPSFDADGNLWVVDIPYGRLFSISPQGGWTLAFSYDGYPHAARLLKSGVYALADHRHGLLRWSPGDADVTHWHSGASLERFRGLGDLCEAPNGDIWMTDPGRSSLSDSTGRLFRLRDGASEPELVLNNIPYPNGVAVSPDGRFVYVSATRANAIWRLMADAPEPVYPMTGTYVQLSGGLGPDGLAVNSQGYLATAHAQAGRAFVFDPIGDVVAQVRTPGGMWTTAVAFDASGQKIYVVEAQTASIYVADLSDIIPASEMRS